MRVRLALGALSNKHFDNVLFPLRTPHDEYLPRYADVLDALELDALHHNPRWTDTMRHWVDQAPDGFRFLPKLWKQATHPDDGTWGDDQLDAARTALDALRPLLDSHRCGPVVVQMAPGFVRSDSNTAWLDDLLDMEPDGTMAVEFRDPSWDHPDVQSFLDGRDTQVVWSTHPKAPKVDWTTGPVGVVRLAGPHYPDKTSRGRPAMKADRLEEILDLRTKLADAPWPECFVAVLNPFEGNAVDSIPRVAAALVDDGLGRRLRRRPGDALLKDPPGAPEQTGLGAFD